MRFSVLILLFAFAPTAAAAPPVQSNVPPACPSDRLTFADDRDGAKAKRLGELPAAKLYLSVDRKVGGCREPLIVRYGIGDAGQARRDQGPR